MNLKDYLPKRLLSAPVEEFQDAFQPQIDVFSQVMWDIMQKELFASTALQWLPLWETAYGIPSEPEKPISYRRSRLLSKMRGAGTTTAEMIRQVVLSYSNSDCEIVEKNSTYQFEIHFVGTIGIPPNMDDVKAAIEEIKPAHLGYQFVYLFRTWDMVSDQTWGELSSQSFAQIKG